MTTPPVERKIITLVSNQWWDSVQDDVRIALELIDRSRRLLRACADGEPFDQAMALDLIDKNLRDLRRLVEKLDTPL